MHAEQQNVNSFWLLQAGGWGALILYSLFPRIATGFGPRDSAAIGVFVLLGILCSLALRRLLRQADHITGGTGLRAVALVTPFAAAWLLFLTGIGDTPAADDGAVGVWLFRNASNFALVMACWATLYLGIRYWRDLQAERQRRIEANALAQQARLQMLRYQLNPHFFFNCLNSIRTLIHDDPPKADEMITRLSDFMRFTLASDESERIPLAKEIDAVRNYLAIEKIRFEDRLAVRIEVDEEAAGCEVPGFLLNPLVENALKHGWPGSDPEPLRIRVRAALVDGRLRIEIANTLRSGGGEPGRSMGTGVANVRQRLQHSYPERHRLETTRQQGWYRTRIEIQ